MKRAIAVPSMVLLIILCTGCALKDLANASHKLGAIVGEIQTDTLLAYNSQPPLISKEIKDGILNVGLKISQGGKQFDAVLDTIDKLTPESRKNLIALLVPISQALNPKEITFIVGIKDPLTKQKIEASFALARSVLGSMQIILAGS